MKSVEVLAPVPPLSQKKGRGKRSGPCTDFRSRPFGALYAHPTTEEFSEKKEAALVSGLRRVVRCQLGGDLIEDHLAAVEPHLGLLI